MEEFEVIMEERNIPYDPDDPKFDAINEISSEDNVVYNKDFVSDYTFEKSKCSCKISDI